MSLATDNQAALRSLTGSASRTAAEAWHGVEPAVAARSWSSRLPAVLAGVTTAQIAAAALAQPFVQAISRSTASSGRVVASAFGGVASDGRPLATLLFQPAMVVILALAAGRSPRRALASGWASLDMIVRTQVADANRLATSVAMTVQPEIIGYERQVHLPACGRCIVLAGRVYRWSQGFARHPRCDCTMAPVTRAQHRETNLDNHPRALFDQMTPEQQSNAFTVTGAQAIRDGADVGQVVNARSGMSMASVPLGQGKTQEVQVTTSGATRRGTAGKRLGAPSGGTAFRLMPEAIYKIAPDRDAAIRLLRQYGYIL